MCRAFFSSSLFVLCCVELSHGEGPKADVLQRIYARLKQDRGITDSKLPYILYTKSVDGAKLQSIEFLRRAADGKGFDLIGTAEIAELRTNETEDTLFILARDVHMKSTDGWTARIDEKVWSIEIPADSDLRTGKTTKSPKKTDLPLSPDQIRFLVEHAGK